MFRRNTLLSFGAIFLFTATLFGAEDPAKMYEQAVEMYKERPNKIQEIKKVLTKALDLAEDEDLRYQIRLLHSMTLYWEGDHAPNNEDKKRIFLEGKKLSDAGIAESPDYAELYYWSATHLGSWALANGPLASLGQKNKIIKTTEMLYETDTMDGELGEDYNHRGADRILGRLFFKLPGFAGGSLKKSLKYLKVAYEKGPKHATNVNYYAESLYNGTKAQKAQAKKILDKLLKEDPKKYNPDRIPETIEEFAEAKKLRNEMGQ